MDQPVDARTLRRYGLLDPVRSSGGLRLYSLDQLARVRRMQGNLAQGLAAAEAAALARQDNVAHEALEPALEVDAARAELLRRALERGLQEFTDLAPTLSEIYREVTR